MRIKLTFWRVVFLAIMALGLYSTYVRYLRGLGAVTVVVNINLNLRQPCHQGDRLRIIRTAPGLRVGSDAGEHAQHHKDERQKLQQGWQSLLPHEAVDQVEQRLDAEEEIAGTTRHQ